MRYRSFIDSTLPRWAALLATGCASFFASPGVAFADERVNCHERHCIDLGLRSGVGVGFGNITDGDPISDRTGGLAEIGVDVGYRLGGVVTIGADASYSRVFLEESSLLTTAVTGDGPCFRGTSCSANLFRFGLDVRVHILPRRWIDPWFGLGAGYEILTVSQNGQTPAPEGPVTFNSVAFSFRGFEYARLELGGEAHVGSAFTLGPFASFSLARYDSASASGSVSVGNETVNLDTRTSRPIVASSFHEWLVFGIRGTFELTVGH